LGDGGRRLGSILTAWWETQSLTNGVIGLATERFTKNLWTDRTSGAKPQLVSVRDEADQARFVVERVLENREAGTLLKQR
jgi:ATP-dependent DNA helicase UvrD/PcrA